MADTERKFAQGFIFKRPREGAPEFVKGSMSIKVMEAIEFLKTAESEWMNLDLLQSKSNPEKLYFVVNEWKPKEDNTFGKTGIEYPENEIRPEDVPFN